MLQIHEPSKANPVPLKWILKHVGVENTLNAHAYVHCLPGNNAILQRGPPMFHFPSELCLYSCRARHEDRKAEAILAKASLDSDDYKEGSETSGGSQQLSDGSESEESQSSTDSDSQERQTAQESDSEVSQSSWSSGRAQSEPALDVSVDSESIENSSDAFATESDSDSDEDQVQPAADLEVGEYVLPYVPDKEPDQMVLLPYLCDHTYGNDSGMVGGMDSPLPSHANDLDCCPQSSAPVEQHPEAPTVSAAEPPTASWTSSSNQQSESSEADFSSEDSSEAESEPEKSSLNQHAAQSSDTDPSSEGGSEEESTDDIAEPAAVPEKAAPQFCGASPSSSDTSGSSSTSSGSDEEEEAIPVKPVPTASAPILSSPDPEAKSATPSGEVPIAELADKLPSPPSPRGTEAAREAFGIQPTEASIASGEASSNHRQEGSRFSLEAMKLGGQQSRNAAWLMPEQAMETHDNSAGKEAQQTVSYAELPAVTDDVLHAALEPNLSGKIC